MGRIDRIVRGAAGWAAGLCLLAAGCAPGSPGRGQIRVTTVPPGATVECDGVRHDQTPLTLQNLAPGKHLIVVNKEGFQEARRTVALLAGNAAVEIKLEPLRGLLLVHSNPPGADVTIDGAFHGQTPLLMPDFPLGNHRLLMMKPGFLPRELAVQVADRIPQKVSADLVSDTGTVVVRAAPENAQVRVNGMDRGMTPCEVVVPSGEIEIQLVAPGYEAYKESIVIAAQERREVSATLKPVPVTLQVVTIPEKARIYVDNQFRGEAPVLLTDLTPGDHRIRAELRGYETQARDISLRREERVVEEFRMIKNSGKLVIVTEPADVKVFLNGEDLGATQSAGASTVSDALEIDMLPPGDYTLQLSRKGYAFTPRPITIAPNGILTLHEKMQRMFIPDVRIRIGAAGDIVREGMLIRRFPNGDVEIQLATGTFLKIRKEEIFAVDPIKD